MINIADISGSMSRVLRDVAVCGSLVSNLSASAQQSLGNDLDSPQAAEYINDFQQETGLSDTSMVLLIDLFGLDELEKIHSPLRLKFAILQQTLLAHPHGSYSTTQVLDAIVVSFVAQYAHLSKQEKLTSLYDMIASLDEFVIEFLLDFYDSDKSSQDVYMAVGGEFSARLKSMLGSNMDDPAAVLTALATVSAEIAEEKKKPIESFTLTKDADDRLIHTHFQRPEVKLYLRYKAATLDFPNKDIVARLRQEKNLDPDMISDVDVITKWDIVPFSIRQQMKIRGGSRSDLELLEQFKKFHYQTFSGLVGRDVDIDTWLLRLFHALQKTLPKQEVKYAKSALKNNEEFSLLPRTTETIAMMLCHAIIHESDRKRPRRPDYNEIVALMADVNTASDQLSQLRDATQDLHFHNEELARQHTLAALKAEQSQLLSLMVDNLVRTIENPKGGFDVQYVLTGNPTRGDELAMCGKNSCVTIRNMVKAGGVKKPIKYLWPAEFNQIDDVLDQGSIPVLRGDVIHVLNTMKKHNLGEILSAPDKDSLLLLLKEQLPLLAVKHNNSIVEIYFNTSGYVTKVDPISGNKTKVWRSKAHRSHLVLGPDGVWQAFDPHYNPAKGVAKKKGFPLDVFLQKLADRIHKAKNQQGYEILINTAAQYGYLADDDIQTLAQGNYLAVSPEAQDLFADRMQSTISLKDLEQYQGFVAEELSQSIDLITSLPFESLEATFPTVQYEILEELFLMIEEIKNPFVKSMVIGYLLQGDVSGLEQELAPEKDPSGVLDKDIIKLLEESYNPEQKLTEFMRSILYTGYVGY